MSRGWLVPPCRQRLTPNRYHAGYRPERVLPVECVILHYTVGYSAEASIRWMLDPAAGVSAHFVVDRDGQVWQLVPLQDRAWHAGSPRGTSRWNGLTINSRSVGVELANLGMLFGTEGDLRDWWGRRYDGPVHWTTERLDWTPRARVIRGLLEQQQVKLPEATVTRRVPWEPYPDEQLAGLRWLLHQLGHALPALHEPPPGHQPRITGHADVDSSRKLDPGPALPTITLS